MNTSDASEQSESGCPPPPPASNNGSVHEDVEVVSGAGDNIIGYINSMLFTSVGVDPETGLQSDDGSDDETAVAENPRHGLWNWNAMSKCVSAAVVLALVVTGTGIGIRESENQKIKANQAAAITSKASKANARKSKSSKDHILWAGSGGGWGAMVAQSAYAQVFSNLGILGGHDDTKPKIKVIDVTSGSSWFTSQFAFSQNYFDAVVNGDATSLGQFTEAWMNAYATTQSNIPPTCGPLQDLCDMGASAGALSGIVSLIPLALYYNQSWSEIVYAMYEAASTLAYDDPNMLSVKASSSEKLADLRGVDVCFHLSLLPNARARDADTITYLAKDHHNVSSSYTVPLPYDYCIGDTDEEWLPSTFPGGNVYNINKDASFANSNVVKGFPMLPPQESDGLYVTPEHDEGSDESIVSLSPKKMSAPFGNDPTALQLSVAASASLGYISADAPSFFAQYFSIQYFGIDNSPDLTPEQKTVFKTGLNQFQEFLWSTGFLANAATNSGWTEPNPNTMPPATESDYWFTDGGHTDILAAAQAIARYQHRYGTSNPIKLIISNQNSVSDTRNYEHILEYFSYSENEGKEPGDFVWPMGALPRVSKQIFGEALSAEDLDGLFEPVIGTDLTMAVLPVATTLDNEPYGVKAGQQVSIAVINLNSNIPSFVLGAAIQVFTPGLVALAEGIASSTDLSDKVAAFVGIDTTP